jgi:hypothetical protein
MLRALSTMKIKPNGNNIALLGRSKIVAGVMIRGVVVSTACVSTVGAPVDF